MKERKITSWNSPEGKELCLHCPFDKCKLDVEDRGVYGVTERRGAAIRHYCQIGLTIKKISEILELSQRIIRNYIRKEEVKKDNT